MSRKRALLGLKALVWALMFFFLWRKVEQGQLSFSRMFAFAQEMYSGHHAMVLFIPVGLVVLNWGLEAKKWQLLSAPVVRLSCSQAMRAVLAGLSMGFVTPRSLGDYAGRMLLTPCENPARLVGAILLNRLSQSFSTYFFGFFGLIYMGTTAAVFSQPQWLWLLPLFLIGGFACLLCMGAGRFYLSKLLKQLGGRRLWKLFQIVALYRNSDMRKLLIYASLRYLVFSLQFLWILKLAGLNLSLSILASGVAVVYLLKSVIPTFNFLSDLGVRELSALWVFSFFAMPEDQLVLASLMLWCLNILLPTFIGGVLIAGLRLNR